MPVRVSDKNIIEMQARIAELELHLRETEETLNAIRNGDVDAIVVSGRDGDKIFSLASSETPYRVILEKMDEGAVTVSSHGTILYSNQSFSRIISTPLERIMGSTFTDLISVNDKDKFNLLLQESLAHPVKGDVTATVSGKTTNLHLSLSTLPEEIGGDICIIVSDTTEMTNHQAYLREMVETRTSDLRKANEKLSEENEKLRNVEMELKNSRERLYIALENGQIGTWEWDFETNRMIWDERMEKMFGLEPGTFSDTFQAFENCLHEEDIVHVREAIDEALVNKKSFETVYRTKPVNGESSFISTKALISYNGEGKPVSMTGVCFDVTAMKKGAAQVLIRMNEDLLRSNTDLQQFAYVASHDLQEPLRMVSSFTQLLQQRYQDKLDKDGIEFIRYAVEGSKRMYELLNGLLAYSRIQTKGREFSYVDMNEVLEKVKENLSLAISETGARISSKKLPVIYADENQMIQLMQNLIENSIKFRNGIPEISITWSIKDDHHIFCVKDKGIGIEPQYFDRIFRIFQRLHGTGEYEGTGIGLAICKRIVERHEGTIWVESTRGEGTKFCFSLPKELQVYDLSI